MSAGQELMDNLEVCRVLGVKSDTWRKRVAAGSAPLPFTRMGARTYYRRADVRYFLRKGRWPASMAFKGLSAADTADVEPGHPGLEPVA